MSSENAFPANALFLPFLGENGDKEDENLRVIFFRVLHMYLKKIALCLQPSKIDPHGCPIRRTRFGEIEGES